MKRRTDRLSYLIFGIGIIMDICVKMTGVYLIPVTEAYMDYIFAGIITVSILCFSFIAIISAFLEKTYFGYKLREIIQFPNSPVNIKRYIIISLVTIVIGTGLLAVDNVVSCANSITALFFGLIYLEGNVAFEIYDLLTDEKHICDLVLEYFSASVREKEMNFEEFQAHTDKVIDALVVYTNENKPDGKDKVCDMLAELGGQIRKQDGKEDYYKYYSYFDSKIRSCMDNFAQMFGFNDMLNSIVRIYAQLSEFEYGRIDLYSVPLKNICFWEDKQLIEFYIAAMMKMHWKTNEEGIEPDVIILLIVLKNFVLNNNDIEKRNYVFQTIVKQVF